VPAVSQSFGCQFATAGSAISLPAMRRSTSENSHADSTGLNSSGIAMRFCHAAGASGDVATPIVLPKFANGVFAFSTACVPRGTITNQHFGTSKPPLPSGSAFLPQPRPGASSPVSTWNSSAPVPSAFVTAPAISFVVMLLK
jgi:hypothetical protein